MFKAVLLVCAQALMIQSIAGQCIGAGWGAPLAGAPYGLAGTLGGACGCAVAVPASSGGGFGVTSASIAPRGVSVLSENAIEGALAVAGALPFLGTVGLEGALPTAGAGAVNYGCGNGAVGIVEELAPAAIAGPLGYGLGAIDGLGIAGPLGLGLGGIDGIGCGGLGYGIAGPLGLGLGGIDGIGCGGLGNGIAGPLGLGLGGIDGIGCGGLGYGFGGLAGYGYGALI